MNNFIQSGDDVILTAPYTRTSGQGAQVGMLFGVATQDVTSGSDAPFRTVGCYTLPKLSTDVIAQGDPLYWDNTNKRLTATATSNLFVGHAIAAAGNGATTVDVRLANPSKAVG